MAFFTGDMYPNLVNVTKRMDPDGNVAKIAEILQAYNPIIEDVPIMEGNLPTGHRTTVRAGIPAPTWRKLNYGVHPTKSTTAQVDDTIGMMEAYSEVDVDLAKLNGNTAEFRMSEDVPHLEGMSQEMADTIFYGDTGLDPEKFLGLAPRYNTKTYPYGKPDAQINSDYLKHVVDFGDIAGYIPAAGSLTSLWFIVWGTDKVHGVYPKGSEAGLQSRDLGEHTAYDNQDPPGRFQIYRTHYQWKMGMVVRDWRYIVRIANIDLALLEANANDEQSALIKAFIKARYTIPNPNAYADGVYYACPAIHAILDEAATFKTNAAFTHREVFGKDVLSFRGTPVKACNAILEDEGDPIT